MFDEAARSWLSQLVADFPVSDDDAAAVALELAMNWAPPAMIEHKGVDLAQVIACKVCGYNAHLHQRAAFLLKAIGGATRLLEETGARRVQHTLCDIRFAEYVMGRLLQRAGGEWQAAIPKSSVARKLRARYPGASSQPDHCPLEAPLDLSCPARGWRDGLDRLPGGPTALFVASMESYLQPLTPLMRELTSRGWNALCLAPAPLVDSAPIAVLPPRVRRVSVEIALGDDLFAVASAVRRRLQAIWRTHWRAIADRLAREGVSVWPIVRTDFKRMFRELLPACAVYVEAALNIHERCNVSAVVVARTRRAFERSVAFALRSRGARVIVAPHGHLGAGAKREFVDGLLDCADFVCAWSDEQRGVIERKRIVSPDLETAVTGAPALDRLCTGRDDNSTIGARVRRRLGVADGESLILLTTQPILWPCFGIVLQAWSSTPRGALIVKPHPRESKGAYEAAIKASGVRRVRVLPGDIALSDAIRACDVLATASSTTNLEALALRAPVVILSSVAQVDALVELARLGLPQPGSPQELAALFARIAANPSKFRRECAGAVLRAREAWLPHMGEATVRVADVIEAVARDGPKRAKARWSRTPVRASSACAAREPLQ